MNLYANPSDAIRSYAIDFGTSNSLLAAATQSGQVVPPIPLDQHAADPTILRSIIFTPKVNEWYFGEEAIQMYAEFSSEGRLLRSLKKFLPRANFRGTVVHGKWMELEDILAIFLRTMRLRANTYFDQDVTRTVLGRPALFSEDPLEDKLAQDRLEKAAKKAGFTEIQFCEEPLAAAYDFRRHLKEEKIVLVADFGGGTSDFTIVKLSEKEFLRQSDVLAMGGISLAGDAFDGSLMKYQLLPHFGSEVEYQLPFGKNILRIPPHIMFNLCSPAEINFLNRQDIKKLLQDADRWSLSNESNQIMRRLFTLIEEHQGFSLFQNIENCKKELSEKDLAIFSFLYPDIDLEVELSAQKFMLGSSELVEKIVAIVRDTLAKAQVNQDQIDIVFCTGGTAKIKHLREALVQIFGEEKIQQNNFFHSVILGLGEVAKDF